jgi:glycerol-3-phosphate O-acyltransferase
MQTSPDLLRVVQRLYPYLQAELFLRWDEGDLEEAVREQLIALREAGLASGGGPFWRAAAEESAEAQQLELLAHPMRETIERYFLVIALLLHAGSGHLSQAELAKSSLERAVSMSRLNGSCLPEFPDRSLFEGFIGLLRRQGVIRADAEGRLVFNEDLSSIAEDARLVLPEQLRDGILQVVQG